MKKSLVLAMAMALGVSATAFAANPFSDVPAGHWAYASVAKLAAAGIVDGYPDGTFKGDNLMTRYEMAQIVAKAYAKGAIGADDKLMAEFADELDNLGVRVAKLEKKADNVKITGEARFGYKDIENKSVYLGAEGDTDKWKEHYPELRTRLFLSGAINDDWSYGAMIQNTQILNTNAEDSKTEFRRAFVRGNIGDATVTAGRQAFTVGHGYVADLTGDALKVDFGKKLKTTMFAGRFDSVVYNGDNDKATLYGVAMNYPFNDKLYTEAGFYAQEGNDDMQELQIYTLGLGYKFDKNVSLYGEYQKANKSFVELFGDPGESDVGDDGWAATLSYKGANPAQKDSWGAYVTYYDQSGALLLDSICELEDNKAWPYEGLKGFEVGVGYTVAKNVVAKVAYYDLENKDWANIWDDSAKMIWSTVTFNF